MALTSLCMLYGLFLAANAMEQVRQPLPAVFVTVAESGGAMFPYAVPPKPLW